MDIHKKFTDRISSTINKAPMALPFEPNVSAYKLWESELPLLNAQIADSQFSNAIQGLLVADIEPMEKFNLAEQTHECLLRLLSICRKEIEGAKLPLTRKQTDITTALLSVLLNSSSIYMDIICSSKFMATEKTEADDNAHCFSEQLKGLVIFRAMELLQISQTLMSLIYKSPKSDFWNSVNALFSLAEDLKSHQFTSLVLDKESSSSIENEFKKIHFLHLARTNRFRQRDIQTIQAILSLQSENILLSQDDQSFEFCVDLDASSPVSNTTEETAPSASIRFINNEILINYMLSKDIVAPNRHGAISLVSSKPLLNKTVISQLLPSWSTTQSRQSARHVHSEGASVYPGFDSIIKALVIKKKGLDTNKISKTDRPKGFDISSLELEPIDPNCHNHHAIHNDNVINKMLKASSKNPLSSDSIWQKKKKVKFGERGEQMAAEVHDTSLQGLRFTVSSDNKSLIKASDLIGVQTSSDSLQLATIRRINNLDDGAVSVGVEMMSPNLKVATIKFHDKEHAPEPVIFLKGVPALKQPDSIISPLLLENTHENILLKTNNKKSTYSIGEIMETNQVYTQYSVLKEMDVD
jgi:hypothetical protein